MLVNWNVRWRCFGFEWNVAYAFIRGSGGGDDDEGNNGKEEEDVYEETLDGVGEDVLGWTRKWCVICKGVEKVEGGESGGVFVFEGCAEDDDSVEF